MPNNLETSSGYYDEYGIFHPNTFLTYSPYANIANTTPIDPSKPYSPLPQTLVNPVDRSSIQIFGMSIPNPAYELGKFLAQSEDTIGYSASGLIVGANNAVTTVKNDITTWILMGVIGLAIIGDKK